MNKPFMIKTAVKKLLNEQKVKLYYGQNVFSYSSKTKFVYLKYPGESKRKYGTIQDFSKYEKDQYFISIKE